MRESRVDVNTAKKCLFIHVLCIYVHCTSIPVCTAAEAAANFRMMYVVRGVGALYSVAVDVSKCANISHD